MSDAEFLQLFSERDFDFAGLVAEHILGNLGSMQSAFERLPPQWKSVRYPADEGPLSVADLEAQLKALAPPTVAALNDGTLPTGHTVKQLLSRLHIYSLDAESVLEQAAEAHPGDRALKLANDNARELNAYATSMRALHEAYEHGRSLTTGGTHTERQRNRPTRRTERE